ncbi:MAG TPA: hypothetical protein EYG21_03420 [Nitrospinaceae bacterium]|nr:hypothetical protein [Nitrospinaceae bacterium]
MKLPKKISMAIIALAIGIIGGASWCLLSESKPLEQKIAEKITEKAIDKVADKAKEELQKKVIDKIFK